MPRYVALLRAINVGGRTVKMDRLRQLFEALDLTAVETFINSGNVIFTARAGAARRLEQKIEAHLQGALGYAVTTCLRTPAELAAIAAHPAFPEAAEEAGALYIAFAQTPPGGEAQARLAAAQTERDLFLVHQREVYWRIRTRFSESPFSGSGKFEKLLGAPVTVRNFTTVRKLADKYPA
jgi:uncharacterized protein (DUF1697 family)